TRGLHQQRPARRTRQAAAPAARAAPAGAPGLRRKRVRYPAGEPRPVMRSFTPRRFDPVALELDIELVVHDGLASSWSRRAAPGDEVEIAGPTGGY
ncbi:MAG: siderophore-interacting protein, partial [Pseudonocardiaceae bacterium]